MSFRKFTQAALFGIAVQWCLFIPVTSFAETALEAVKSHTDNALVILWDPWFASKQFKIEKLRSVSDEMFDFDELSKRTLDKNWDMLNSQQQKGFIQLYKSLLEETFADQILALAVEKIVYLKEVPLTDTTFEVQSMVLTKQANIPISYRVASKNGTWRVYDVTTQGGSLISNYGAQFKEMLKDNNPESLLEAMRNMTEFM